VRIVTNPLRILMIERDNLQASYSWRNPREPKVIGQPARRLVALKRKFLREAKWVGILRGHLWEDPLTGNMLPLDRAYYTQLRRSR
jgi:hypothetical protein